MLLVKPNRCSRLRCWNGPPSWAEASLWGTSGVSGLRPQPILAVQESGSVNTQPVSFPIRLPDALQAEALRLLDASRGAINQLLLELWPQLDRFAAERTGPAWKQVERYETRRSGHGNRQERGEMEQAGRILRAQATRKQV